MTLFPLLYILDLHSLKTSALFNISYTYSVLSIHCYTFGLSSLSYLDTLG